MSCSVDIFIKKILIFTKFNATNKTVWLDEWFFHQNNWIGKKERKKICESHFLFFVKTNGKYKNYFCEIIGIEIQTRILKGLGLTVAQLEIRVVI